MAVRRNWGLFVSVAALTLAGCGHKDAPPPETKAGPAAKASPAPVNPWSKDSDAAPATEPAKKDPPKKGKTEDKPPSNPWGKDSGAAPAPSPSPTAKPKPKDPKAKPETNPWAKG